MFIKFYQSNTVNALRRVKREWGYNLYDLVRSLTQRQILSQVVNKQEIRVVGLRRSGNHAVTNWVKEQQSGQVLYLNNIPPKENGYRVLYQHYPKEHLRREALGHFVNKDCLIYSYEDWDLEQITDQHFEKKHDLYWGKSDRRYDLLILRDPFNTLASRLKNNFIEVKDPNQTFIELWLSYAKEYLGETNHLKNNKVCINYNQWFLDVSYRKEITSNLKLEFSDAGINQVKAQGGGSSFEGREFDGKAIQMKVLDRWKVFAEDPRYLKLLGNEEILEYSKRIFGDLPGTEVLYKR
ncbi:MAG: hypothetical protein F6K58_10230 [Symploca sp. SIO2E9]|nr:hypothetical protein [Symploca sp. SIO2E9]